MAHMDFSSSQREISAPLFQSINLDILNNDDTGGATDSIVSKIVLSLNVVCFVFILKNGE